MYQTDGRSFAPRRRFGDGTPSERHGIGDQMGREQPAVQRWNEEEESAGSQTSGEDSGVAVRTSCSPPAAQQAGLEAAN